MNEMEEVRIRRAKLRDRKRELEARLADGGDKVLQWEIAGVAEDIISADRWLREQMPRHRISYKTIRTVAAERSWDWAQYHTWAELEQAEEQEGPTERDLMRDALCAARAACTDRQAEYLGAVERGFRAASVARRMGRDKSTVSRTLHRGRDRITREAWAVYRLKRAVAQAQGGVLDLRDPEAMDALLGMLTDKQQLYIYLYYGEWMSLGEIGSLLGVDRAGVMRTIRRGLERVAGELAGLSVTGLESLEERLTEHFSELTPEDLKAKPGYNSSTPGVETTATATEVLNEDPLEEGRDLFQGGGGGKLRAWLEEIQGRIESAQGRAMPRGERQGFFRRLLRALVRKFNERRTMRMP